MGLTLGLVWILAGCTTILPIVVDQIAQLSFSAPADDGDTRSGDSLIDRAGEATAAGRFAEAAAYLEAALSIDPYDEQALRQLAVIYRITGRPEKAMFYEDMARSIDAVDSGSRTAVKITPKSSDDADIIQRFVALARIFDARLITEKEYDFRRTANLGALLPLTQPPPLLNTDRKPPQTRDVIERLTTITRFKEAGALDHYAFTVERDAILDGLMPLSNIAPQTADVVISETLDLEAHQRWIDRLLETKLISQREYNKESAVLVGLYTPAAGVSDDADSTTPGNLSMTDQPISFMDKGVLAQEEIIILEEAAITPEAAIPEEAMLEETKNDTAMTSEKTAITPEAAMASTDQTDEDVDSPFGSLAVAEIEDFGSTPDIAPTADQDTRVNIHLALSRTPESAQRSWDDLQLSNGLILDGLIPHVSRVDLGDGKGVFFQLSAGPLADMAAAEAVCDELLSRDYYCAPLVF